MVAMFLLDPESKRFSWFRLLWLLQNYGIENLWIRWAGLVLCGLWEFWIHLYIFVYLVFYWFMLFTVYTLNINYWLDNLR